MTSKWRCRLGGSLLFAVLLSAKATVAFSPTRSWTTQISHTNLCLKSNTIAAFSVAISALVPLLIAYVANNKMDTLRMEDQIIQTSLKEREEFFQLQLKKLETSNEKKA